VAPCGCFITKSAEHFFPVHEAMRLPSEFEHPRDHALATKALAEDAAEGRWPPAEAFTAQYWTLSWADPDVGAYFVNGLKAARGGAIEEAEKLLLTTTWSKWGTKYKYQNHPQPPAVNLARNAFEKSLLFEPTYPFAYYELGNLRLEESQQPGASDEDKQTALVKAEELYATAVELRPDLVLFVNNLGVARLNAGKPAEALQSFRSVLELNDAAFSTVAGLDPEAGAHLNIGHALFKLGEADEAARHWLEVLHNGTYEYATQAAQSLQAAKRYDVLPPPPRLDLLYGDALAKAGRAREAAVRFASAYMGAPRTDDEEELTDEGHEFRNLISKRMNALSEVWAEGDGRPISPSERSKAAAKPKEMPTIVQAAADGSTTVQKLTPELLAQLQAGQHPSR